MLLTSVRARGIRLYELACEHVLKASWPSGGTPPIETMAVSRLG